MEKSIKMEEWGGICINCGQEKLLCIDLDYDDGVFVRIMECENCKQRAEITYELTNSVIEFMHRVKKSAPGFIWGLF